MKAALAQVALTGLEERKPGQLSGGQQQRVALARALVVEPPVLLCDEPLGALDRKLRQQMQFELKELQKRLGVTLVFVTHDQEEALAMSDRIAVMNKGRVEQVGAPTEIYERPRTRFVADFIGEINILEEAGQARALRPEKIRLVPPADARVAGIVETANFLGGSTLYRVRAADGRSLLVRETHAGERASRDTGDTVGLAWNDADAVTLDLAWTAGLGPLIGRDARGPYEYDPPCLAPSESSPSARRRATTSPTCSPPMRPPAPRSSCAARSTGSRDAEVDTLEARERRRYALHPPARRPRRQDLQEGGDRPLAGGASQNCAPTAATCWSMPAPATFRRWRATRACCFRRAC